MGTTLQILTRWWPPRRPASDAEERANATAMQNRKIQRREDSPRVSSGQDTRRTLAARKRVNLPAYGTRRPRRITPRTFSHMRREERRVRVRDIRGVHTNVMNADSFDFVFFFFFIWSCVLHCRRIRYSRQKFLIIKSTSARMHGHGRWIVLYVVINETFDSSLHFRICTSFSDKDLCL